MEQPTYHHITYDATGNIAGLIEAPVRYMSIDQPLDTTRHYVDVSIEPPAISPRIDYEPSVSIAGLTVTLTGVPAGVNVTVIEKSVVADDEPTELVFDRPGTYHVSLRGDPFYVVKSLEVTVGDA